MDILIFNIKILKKRGSIKKIVTYIPITAFLLTIACYISSNELINSGDPIYSYFFFDVNKRAILNGLLVLLPLLMAFVYGDYHYYERAILHEIMIRQKPMYKQFITNAMLSFCLGFIIVLEFLSFMFLFNFIITYHPEHTLTFNSLSTSELNIGGMYFSEFFLKMPYVYVLFQTILLSIYGAFLSLSTYVISLFCKAKIITYMSTMCMSLVSMFILWMFLKPLGNWNLQMVFSPQLVHVKNHNIAIISWLIFFLLFNVIFLIIRIRRRESI